MLKTSFILNNLFYHPKNTEWSENDYSLDLRMHFIGLKFECLRPDPKVAYEDDSDLKSQSSTVFGTQTSNKIWPRIPWALIFGGDDRGMKRSLGASWTDPTSRPSWYSTEPGTTKWSFKSRVIRWKLWYWFEVETASLRWRNGSEVSSLATVSRWVLDE